MRLSEEQQRLVDENQALAVSVAKQCAKVWPFEYEDIVGAAFVGLCFAAIYFRPELGWQFSTYATWSIKRNAWRSLASTRLVHVPLHHFTNRPDTVNARQEFAEQVKAAVKGPVSLGSIDLCADMKSHADEILDREDNEIKLRWLRQRLYTIPKRDKEIFMRRIAGETYISIAASYGLSKERVRQVIETVKSDLRKSAERKFAGLDNARSNQHSI